MHTIPLIPHAPACDDPLQRSFEFSDPETGKENARHCAGPGHWSAAQHFVADLQLPGGLRYRIDLHVCPWSRRVLSYRLTPTR